MEESHVDTLSQTKSFKAEEIETSKTKSKKSKLSHVKKIINIFTCFGDLFLSLLNKINSCLTKCSIIVQFSLFLIPISIVIIILLYFIHVSFYTDLYIFNFSKTYKEEFLDLYITQIDDLKTEVTAMLVKETQLDLENQLFFQVYFKELSSVGFLNNNKNENKKFIHTFEEYKDSVSLFSSLNRYKEVDVNFTVDMENVKTKIDGRNYDNLGELAKIYYYMFPFIWYETVLMNSIINQSFFLAYEYEKENKNILNDYLFFRYPKNSDGFKINDNFIPCNYILNPLVSEENFEHAYYCDTTDYYCYINWFKYQDYQFRKSINTEQKLYTKISLSHLNIEHEGGINKTFITYSQQYLKNENKLYIINIIFYMNQINLQEGDNDYSSFIIKMNGNTSENEEKEVIKYADNASYVLTISDSTEYSLTEMDYRFFHLGLYDNNYNFYMNGIFYDSFNLDFFYDYSKFYSTAKEGEYDLKFYTSLYLYKTLFQNIKYKKIEKNREEIFLYHFRKGDKVSNICKKINFNSYREYLKNTGIDCWDKRNKLYYSINNFLYITMSNDSNTIEPIYPYCSCLPLYCLKNYIDLDEDLDNIELSDKINLPNKCQNKFTSYETVIPNQGYEGNNKILKLIDSSLDSINYDYVKFIVFELNQLPGYIFLIISQIKTSGEAYIHNYYKLITKIEIIILILGVLVITSILSIIIISNSLKKYSLIIENFKKKYEFFIFHSECDAESNSNKSNNLNKYMRRKEEKKV